MKTIILGIGNPLLGDDGVGVHVARQLRTRISHPLITIDESYTGGMNLLDLIRGYDRAILIDTIHKNDQSVGSVDRYDLSDLPTTHSSNPHDTSLSEAIMLARHLGDDHIPKKIIIYGISLQEHCRVFTEQLSHPIQNAIPKTIDLITSDLESMNNEKEKVRIGMYNE